MNDSSIRQALKAELAVHRSDDPDTLILDELGIGHGAVRADVAVINSSLHGYEIKSARDTLKRLPEQIRLYSAVFDRVTLIVAYKHAYEALQLVPLWWGVTLVAVNPQQEVVLSEAREAQANPTPDPLAIAMLLWRQEALDLLEELGAAEGVRSKPRHIIYARVVERVDLETLRARVRQQLKARANWRVGEEQKRGDG